ncbi:MAG: phage/plasmid primase, P4 family [Pseudolabrys sp.]
MSFAHPPKKPANPSPSPSRAADYGHKTAQSVQCPQSIDADQKRGARLVTAVETEEGRRWAESRIKSLTGSEKISARFMRQDFFEFLPQFKLIIAGNHKPGLRSVDEAIRRRFNLIPFTITIPPSERDELLPEKLKAELPGILAWMIRGCTDWLERGLSPPQMVTEVTAAYLESEDAVAAWIEDCAARDPNAFAKNTAARSDFPKTSKPGDLHRIVTGNSAVDLTGSDFRAPTIDKRTFEKASKIRGVTHVTVILLIDATRARGGIIPKTCQICHGVYFGHFRLREIPKGVPFQFNSDNVDMGGVVV